MAENSAVCWERADCPLCAAAADATKPCLHGPDRLFEVPGTFQLVRCGSCGHVYVNPRPTPDSIGIFYPEHYGPHHLLQPESTMDTKNDARKTTERSPWYLAPLTRKIPGLRSLYYWLKDGRSEITPPLGPAGGIALELGCADGRFLERLRALGWHIQGVEPAEKPAQLARKRGFEVHQGTLESNLFPANHFDAVFAWMVIEHVHEPRQVLKEVRRVLKDSGSLVISVPNFACWERRVFRTFWYALGLPIHLQQFTPRTLRALLHECGFDQVQIIHQRNLLNVVGSLGLWLRAVFPNLSLGSKLVHFPDSPTMWGELALAPCAKILAWIRQGGRLTVIAKPHR
jgi:2-polyprenyl-3-methyl-5-hydroxy-6-metoxy-1,4-benzoquinol methylase